MLHLNLLTVHTTSYGSFLFEYLFTLIATTWTNFRSTITASMASQNCINCDTKDNAFICFHSRGLYPLNCKQITHRGGFLAAATIYLLINLYIQVSPNEHTLSLFVTIGSGSQSPPLTLDQTLDPSMAQVFSVLLYSHHSSADVQR